MKEPLAFRVRPNSLDDIIGQEQIVGEHGFLRKSVIAKTPFSIILFGPPGTGKTSLAIAYAKDMGIHYIKANAVTISKKEMEAAIEEAKMFKPCFLIMDEVHRLDKAKQDFLLPFVEDGTIYLIGCTTGNPYIVLSKAIRSRTRLLEVTRLNENQVVEGLMRAISDEKGLQNSAKFNISSLHLIARLSNGDLRFALNLLEVAAVSFSDKDEINEFDINEIEKVPNYAMDNNEEEHYDSVSALQKSIRGSDVNAALYYLARLSIANDLDSISRRLLVTAYEDVGLGNPNAVFRTQLAIDAANKLGFPEAIIPLGVAVIDLCLSPHSRLGADSAEYAYGFVSDKPAAVKHYLRYTPVNLKEEDKYPYNRPDLWKYIQYLPDDYKDMEFLKFDNSEQGSYVKSLLANYVLLKKINRSDDLAELKKGKK